jgi:2-C-methyl-D-erythritol 4-phosphate cytidylyltransferase
LSVVGIIPAAGRGERLGSDRPKAFVVCAGRPLIEWSLDVLRAVCDRVVVAVPPGMPLGPDSVEGGPVRSDSVRRALAAAPEAEVVVVHDAARPLVTRELVERCIAGLEGYDASIAAARVTDTIKQVDERGRVVKTLDRSTLWAIQTPQVFNAAVLRRALDVPLAALETATDDAALVEDLGGRVHVIDAPPGNIKVTNRHDLDLAVVALRPRC